MRPEQIVGELDGFIRAVAGAASQDPDLRDDLKQEAYVVAVAVVLKYEKLEPPELLLVMKRSIRNRLVDLIRNRRGAERTERRAARPEAFVEGDGVVIRDMVQFIRDRIRPDDVDVLDLTLEGFRPDEVAEVIGCSRVSVFRALARVKREVPRDPQ